MCTLYDTTSIFIAKIACLRRLNIVVTGTNVRSCPSSSINAFVFYT